ncbi:MAG TPA: hypothetical protein VFU78_03640, partial [Thermomicrobiales bacterium]|nr:hypothetical protein [Thermomicrobiales bacterium]
PNQIVVSARLVRAKGTAVGQIIATSKAYELAMSQVAPSPPVAATGPQAPTSPAPAASQLPFGRPLPPAWPGTVTPTSAGVPVYGASYAPTYVVAPAAAYAYPAPGYYAPPPVVGPQLSFAYFGGGYGRRGWRR